MTRGSSFSALIAAVFLVTLPLCLCFVQEGEIMGRCDHDEVMARKGGRQSFGRYNQTYGALGRRGTKGNLRIFISADFSGMDDANRDLYTNTILPMAVNKLSEMLYVNPVQGNLL